MIPDAEGVSGMSASKMRAAAEKGDFDSFKTGIPSTLNDADKKKLYLEVRKNMGIREEREMGDDYDSLRDAYLTGKIWNVGEVVEANGISGEVVRKGTNYLSFVADDGKVHKAWLHEVKSPLQKLKDFDKSRVAAGKPPIFTDKKPPKFIRMKKSGQMTIMNVPTDEIDKFEKKGYEIIEDLVGVKPMSGPTGQIFALKSEETELGEKKEYYAIATFSKRAKSGWRRVPDTRFDTEKSAQAYGMKYHTDKYGSKMFKVVTFKEETELDEGPKTHFVYQRDVPKSKRILHRGNEQSSKDWIKKNAKLFIHKGKDFDIYKGKSNNVLPTDKLDWQYVAEEVELDERNYAKEYANYGGRPEQIARRSSRNKARRAMGDKAVKGMDVGHADNNPMNNDPKNLRNEDPSKNRREPRLREEDEVAAVFSSFFSHGSAVGKLVDKIDSIVHPKRYKSAMKKYASLMAKDRARRMTPGALAMTAALEVDLETESLIKYINGLVAKGKLPQALKAEYQEEETMQTFSDLVKQINEVKQDKDVDDKDGTQPAKYYAGDMAKSTKSKRDAHFKAKKSGPAPGDADAKTKPSTHTKKFKQMYGEVLPDDADQGDYIDDFEKSDAPQFKGKSKEKRKDMAIAAYLSKNESFLDNVNKMLSESGHTDVASMKNKVQIAMSALQKMQAELGKLGDEDDLPTWWTNKVATAVSRLDDMSDYLDTQVESVELDEKIEGLVKKAEKSGMSYSILKKVYDRGMAAWKTGHRPGTTPQQWAFARVNSFTTKSAGTWGKADKDLAKQVEQIEEACWVGYKQVGMKKKGNKEVPNCVPEEKELNEWGEIEEESEYQGRKVTLNKPTAGDVKKSKVYVKNEKGTVVKVNFGDPNMTIKKSNPARRKSFRARHNCDNPGPKWKARYWSCKAW